MKNTKFTGLKPLNINTNPSSINFTSDEIDEFIRFQNSDEALAIRHGIDQFSAASQHLYDKGDKNLTSNALRNGVVCLKPYGSSYFSRVSQDNFTEQGKLGIIAVQDHVMTFIDNSLYDSLTSFRGVSNYAKCLNFIAQEVDHYKQKISQNSDFQVNTWTYLESGDRQLNSFFGGENFAKKRAGRYLKINDKNNNYDNQTRIYAIEQILEKSANNLEVKSFIENGRFGHQNNCAVITSFLLTLKSAFGDNVAAVDEVIFSMISKLHKTNEVKIRKTEIDGIKIVESEPRLDVRSVRTFFTTFLAVQNLYLNKGIDISQNQELYAQVIEKLVHQFRPLEKEIKDDVGNPNFWNHQKRQLDEFFELERQPRNRVSQPIILVNSSNKRLDSTRSSYLP